MSRIVFVWLPLWPIERMRRAARTAPAAPGTERDGPLHDPAVPFALVASGAKGLRLSALNECALGQGLRVGMALNDARAGLPRLATRPAEPGEDRAELDRLALWCGRYGPCRNIYGVDGLWVDSAGVAHLYGGEQAMLEDITRRLAGFGITARVAIADTFGAAHALAHHATSRARPATLAPAGAAATAIAALPVEALRLEHDHIVLLKRLGLRRISQLSVLPRAALARRFREGLGAGRAARAAPAQAMAVLARLDQAEGRLKEPLRPLVEPPARLVRHSFAEPLLTAEGVAASAGRLAQELCGLLADAGEGARRFTLGLYRADGTVASAHAATSKPCRDPDHLLQLLSRSLEKVDAGFGIDVLTLAAQRIEPLAAHQTMLVAGRAAPSPDALARLVDRLAGRLGAACVSQIEGMGSHLPERAERRMPALSIKPALPSTAGSAQALRPPFLLARPEPVMVVAEVPEGAPQRFTWRRLARRVVRAEGPERIGPEWWREIGWAQTSPERDYYRVEDEEGRRYWLFRAGRYGGGADEHVPGWFVHGLFA